MSMCGTQPERPVGADRRSGTNHASHGTCTEAAGIQGTRALHKLFSKHHVEKLSLSIMLT